jgi:SAM-dependent methyltransferase
MISIPAPQMMGVAPRAVPQERIACNLCGIDDPNFLYRKPDTRFWISDESFDVVRCRACGLGYVNPRPTRQAIAHFYPPAFYERRGVEYERKRYETQAQYLADRVPGRILDVGCARGAFLKILHERGWEVEGTDRFAAGNDFGFPIRYGEFPDLRYPTASFDVVTAWGVFEHLHDPMSYFRETARVLKPGGRFVCLVTNLNSAWSRFAYADDVPRHLYFFSARSLRRYADEVGLRLCRVDYSGSVLRPDTTDLFRVRALRRLGVPWQEIYRPGRRSIPVTVVELAARAMGRTLFDGPLEAWLHLTGVIVAIMERPGR